MCTGHITIQIRDLTMSIKHTSVELSVHKMYHDGVQWAGYIFFVFSSTFHTTTSFTFPCTSCVYICFIKSYKTSYIQFSTVFYEHGKTKYGMPCWFCFWKSVIYYYVHNIVIGLLMKTVVVVCSLPLQCLRV